MWKLLQTNILFAATLIFNDCTSTVTSDPSDLAPTPQHTVYNPEFAKYFFVAPEKLNLLVQIEWNVYIHILNVYDSYSKNLTSREQDELGNSSTRVKMYLDDFQKYILKAITKTESSSEKSAEIIENISWNPSLAYKVISLFRKYTQIWDGLKLTDDKLMKKIASSLDNIKSWAESSETGEDAALYAIWSVQHDFNLTVQDISNGIVKGINTHVILNAEDCLRIGMYIVSINYITTGIHWLEYALHLTQNGSDNSVVSEELDDALLTAQVLQSHLDFKQWRVCNGEFQQSAKEKSELFCWYEHEIHPSYKIGPIKAEFYSVLPKPEVVQFYDIINDEIIRTIKNFTMFEPQELIGGSLVKERFVGHLLDKRRTAHTLLRIVNRLTGLETLNDKVEEPCTIFVYPSGTGKERHTDRGNDAIITSMFYLTDVGKGGETAFATTGVKVIPHKLSVTIWYNRLTDGSLDELTDHGSCPVGFGEKWVALNQIAFQDQHYLQCHRSPKTRFEIPVNGKSKKKNPLN